ncbi:SH3 domain-containing protein 19 [Xenopus laevis]|uniref:SH3 domain-containing protein 19 n=1 Tax=Xenopus laevis TaxID=8355 RepID=A0A8J0U880_XENLA|nr:SH3 domain-containing protein 19 [Xenopus laevis]
MAEAWLEEEEEELREIRDSAGNRRHRRSNLNQAAERPERNKPEHRFPGQGPLSSIRAVIKRTSRTTTQSEQQRERRRPEITIVAAEPIGPGSWFHGGPPAGLGFPPPPPPQWRPSESHPAEPPSYEQVIKEINQVQVTTSNCNAEPRRTTTCATQTDFQVDEEQNILANNVIDQPVFCNQEPLAAQKAPEISRLSLTFLTSNVNNSTQQVSVCNSTEIIVRQDDANAFRPPVPRPRTKSNLRPVANNFLSIYQENGEQFVQSTPEGEHPSIHPCSSFDDRFFEANNMSHERSQNIIVSRIKAFESQTDASEPPRRPEIVPRTFNNRGSGAVKPTPAPKPVSNKTSGEWELANDNKLKVIPREGFAPSKLPDAGGTDKPGLPKKPKPGLAKSSSSEFSDPVLGTSLSLNNNIQDAERKVPIPAPRPMFPKKLLQSEPPVLPTAVPRPHAAPKPFVATQAKAFSTSELPAVHIPPPAAQNKPVGELDLISFDDDALSPVLLPSPEVTNVSKANTDPFQVFSTDSAEKEQPLPPALQRKPTVIRISGKLGKSSEELQVPPPLPAEKPVGSLYSKSSVRPRPVGRKDWESTESVEDAWTKPALPTRPVGIKVKETPSQPQKGPPGRPPPPKVSRNSTRDAFPRSASDVGFTAKHNTSGISRSKSHIIKRQQPDLPPRPKPGHPLYNKYTLPLPHGIADKDVVSSKPGELSCKRGEVLVLLEQTDNNYIQCQKGSATGEVKTSNMTIITPLNGNVETRNNVSSADDSHVPHALVLHDFRGDQATDLSLNSGETVYLLEKIDNEWYRGKCKGSTGLFPTNHIRVIVDVPSKGLQKKPSFQCSIKGPRCIARFEFIGDHRDELSFSEGDMITLKEYINVEWAKGELKGQTGCFPINFVEIIEDLPSSGLSKNMADAVQSQKKLGQQPHVAGKWAEALYDFNGEAEEDLPFKKGDKIQLIERLDAEWYKGRLNGREGVLPSAFVQVSSGMKPWQTQEGNAGKARALYDFCGESDDELSFKAGDLISALESIDREWMCGELNGKSGIFPKNFVQQC